MPASNRTGQVGLRRMSDEDIQDTSWHDIGRVLMDDMHPIYTRQLIALRLDQRQRESTLADRQLDEALVGQTPSLH